MTTKFLMMKLTFAKKQQPATTLDDETAHKLLVVACWQSSPVGPAMRQDDFRFMPSVGTWLQLRQGRRVAMCWEAKHWFGFGCPNKHLRLEVAIKKRFVSLTWSLLIGSITPLAGA